MANPTGAYFVWTDTDADGNPVGQSQSLYFDCVISEDWNLDTTVTEHPVETGANVADNVRVSLATVTLEVFCTNEPIGRSAATGEVAQLTTTAIDIDGPKQRAKGPTPLVAKEWEAFIQERALARGVGGAVGNALGGTAGAIVGTVAGNVIGGLILAPKEVDVPFDPGAGLEPTPAQKIQLQTYQFQTGGDFVAQTWAKLKFLKGDPALGNASGIATDNPGNAIQPKLITVIGTKDAYDNMVIESLNPHRDAETGTGARFTIGLKQLRLVSAVTVTAPAPTVPGAKPTVNKGTQNPKDVAPNVSDSWLKHGLKLMYSTLGGPPTGPNFAGGE